MTAKTTFADFEKRLKESHDQNFVVLERDFLATTKPLKFYCASHKKNLQVEKAYQLVQGNPCKDCRLDLKFQNYLTRFKSRLKENYPNFTCVSLPKKFGGEVTLTCKTHGDFETTADGVMHAKTNCRSCKYEKVGEKNRNSVRVTFVEFKKRFRERFGDDLRIITKKKDYLNFSSLVTAKCQIQGHEEETKTAQNWLKCNGCKHCNESQGERLVRLCLQKLGIVYEKEKRFASCRDKKELPFDFWLPDYSTLIEFQGRQHEVAAPRFGGTNALKGTKKRDRIKRDWVNDNNLNLIYISSYKSAEIRRTIVEGLRQTDSKEIEETLKRIETTEQDYIDTVWSDYLARLREKHKNNLSFEETKWQTGMLEISYECLNGHGERTGNLQNLLKGHGCGECAGNQVSKEEFIRRSIDKFGPLNFEHSELDYRGMDIQTNITCRIHGNLNISPENHLWLKQGCRKCGGVAEDFSPDSFLRKAEEKFGENNRFSYSKMDYKGTGEKIEIICTTHDRSFWTLPGEHIRVNKDKPHLYLTGGCVDCLKEMRTSPLSKKIVVEGREFQSISAAASHYGLKSATVRKRIKDGWEIDRTFKTPVRVKTY